MIYWQNFCDRRKIPAYFFAPFILFAYLCTAFLVKRYIFCKTINLNTNLKKQ